jgi:hypothetical protein
MQQNKYFSPGRFARLLRNDLMINQKTYLFTLAGFGIAIYALIYFLMITSKHFSNSNYIGLFIFYLMGMGFFIGKAFPAMTNQIKTSNYLLVPGSTFEKFMVQFVIRIVIFIPLAMTIFWIATHLAKASLIPDPLIASDPAAQIQDFHFWNLFNNHITNLDKQIIILSVFSMATIFFAGSVYFNRFALVKTVIISGIIVFLVVCAFVLFSHIFYSAQTHGFDIHNINYKITEDLYNTQLAYYVLGGLSWLFFLPLAYFKIKEKEV